MAPQRHQKNSHATAVGAQSTFEDVSALLSFDITKFAMLHTQ